ncbi:uncharacterized protein LOC131841264 [Achroia grisella]|uniref:uncharacterized protein LOC131841264 n=1 Tax=Achroia grisella TaxID=688607 RepID=UPI0027D2A889|nr:uncharacterized protein LOC131841264 [Achroia grisella]
MEGIMNALKEIQNELEEQKITIRESGKKVTEQVTQNINNILEEKFFALEENQKKLKELVDNQEKRIEKQARQRNIVFFGIEETETSYENLERNIIQWIEQYFSIKLTYSDIQEIKRLGNKRERPRPVVVTFLNLGIKIKIYKQKRALKDTIYYMKEYYPKYVLEKRKELQEQLQLEREKGNIVFLKYDKIVISKQTSKRKFNISPKNSNKNITMQEKEDNIQINKKKKSQQSGSSPKRLNSTSERQSKASSDINDKNKQIETRNIKNLPTRLVTVEEYDQNPPKKNSQIRNNFTEDQCHTLNIITYNVRSLSSYDRLLELEESLSKINYDIIGISEVRRHGNEIEEYETLILCYIGHTPGKYGVGFIINKSLKNNIESFTGISERVALLNMNNEGHKLSIIQVYAPTDAASDHEIEEFYNTIDKAIKQAHKHIILMGDFNAKIGAPKDQEYIIMKQYGYGERNERGQRLVDFALEQKLTIINTYFKKKPNRRWT